MPSTKPKTPNMKGLALRCLKGIAGRVTWDGFVLWNLKEKNLQRGATCLHQCQLQERGQDFGFSVQGSRFRNSGRGCPVKDAGTCKAKQGRGLRLRGLSESLLLTRCPGTFLADFVVQLRFGDIERHIHNSSCRLRLVCCFGGVSSI